jgi:leucyl/phenylalanyl-tRNA--protein transferase
MPIFLLTEELAFPPPGMAEPEGVLAVGGDLSPERMELAYSMGIFPWYSEGQPILWWSPDPRLVLFPNELKISRSLRQTIKKGLYRVTMDTAFEDVVEGCARVHRDDDGGTWITQEMKEAYIALNRRGRAHSVEAWGVGGELAGGLYGVALGGAFFGESMFHIRTDASKVALVALVERLKGWGFELIDCQVTTAFFRRMGAREIPREEFLERLEGAKRKKVRAGKRWSEENS